MGRCCQINLFPSTARSLAPWRRGRGWGLTRQCHKTTNTKRKTSRPVTPTCHTLLSVDRRTTSGARRPAITLRARARAHAAAFNYLHRRSSSQCAPRSRSAAAAAAAAMIILSIFGELIGALWNTSRAAHGRAPASGEKLLRRAKTTTTTAATQACCEIFSSPGLSAFISRRPPIDAMAF